MATDLFLAPGQTSEDIIDAVIVEEAPALPDESFTEKAQRYQAQSQNYLKKEPCPICGREIAAFRMQTHVKYKHGTEDAPTANPRERAPKAPKETQGKRTKADEILTLIASGVGSLFMATGVSAPTGMALKLESVLLGPALDKAAAGTIVDKALLQPLVRTKGKLEEVAPLVMFPMIVFAIDKNPALYPQLYPMLRMTAAQMLPGLVAAMKVQAAEAEKMRKAAAELSAMDPGFAEMFGNGEGDPLDAIIATLFSVATPTEPPAPEEPGSAWEGA